MQASEKKQKLSVIELTYFKFSRRMRIKSQLTAFNELPVGTFCHRGIASPLLFYDYLLINEHVFVHFGLFCQYACDAENYTSN